MSNPTSNALVALAGIAVTRRRLARQVAASQRRQCPDPDPADPCYLLGQAEGSAAAWDAIAQLLADALAQQRGMRP